MVIFLWDGDEFRSWQPLLALEGGEARWLLWLIKVGPGRPHDRWLKNKVQICESYIFTICWTSSHITFLTLTNLAVMNESGSDGQAGHHLAWPLCKSYNFTATSGIACVCPRWNCFLSSLSWRHVYHFVRGLCRRASSSLRKMTRAQICTYWSWTMRCFTVLSALGSTQICIRLSLLE
jgi:hypothetical protein